MSTSTSRRTLRAAPVDIGCACLKLDGVPGPTGRPSQTTHNTVLIRRSAAGGATRPFQISRPGLTRAFSEGVDAYRLASRRVDEPYDMRNVRRGIQFNSDRSVLCVERTVG
jgi:hypothetical protein